MKNDTGSLTRLSNQCPKPQTVGHIHYDFYFDENSCDAVLLASYCFPVMSNGLRRIVGLLNITLWLLLLLQLIVRLTNR